MVSRMFKGVAATVATLSLAGTASAGCGAGLYCGQSSAASVQPISSWTGQSSVSEYAPSESYSTLSSYQADSTYGTGSISQAYSAQDAYSSAGSSYGSAGGSFSSTGSSFGSSGGSFSSAGNTVGFSGSLASVPGLGANESLQPTNCPVNVFDNGEGTVMGCYNVVRQVPQTTYQRVVRPVVYVRYPVPVAVPYTSPCLTVTQYSRYGGLGGGNGRRGCR